ILVPPDQPDELPNIMARLRRGERITDFETVRLHQDGSRVEVSVSISPLRDAGGALIGAATIARDVSQRQRTERQATFLAELTQQLSSSLDYRTTLETAARLVVPVLADVAVLYIGDGQVADVAAFDADPGREALMRQLEREYRPDLANDRSLVATTMRSGRPQ